MYNIRDTEAAVRQVQTYLLEISHATEGLAHIAIDGIYGSETEAAVRDFQERYDLSPTGEVDFDTWEKLRHTYEAAKHERTATPTLLPNGVLPLSSGDRGSAVYLAQVLLAALCDRYTRLPCLPINGYFGSDMTGAVRIYQSYMHLPLSGIIDFHTWENLCADYKRNGRKETE